MHRARSRRHPAAAHEGAPAPRRFEARRSPFLFHDVRMDDVELARVGAGIARHHPALRRLAVRCRGQSAVRLRRRGAHDGFGTSAKYIDSLAKLDWKPRATHRLSSVKTLLST